MLFPPSVDRVRIVANLFAWTDELRELLDPERASITMFQRMGEVLPQNLRPKTLKGSEMRARIEELQKLVSAHIPWTVFAAWFWNESAEQLDTRIIDAVYR